jgi:hypothetical protein
MTSGAKSDGRFGKQDFVYLPIQDVYRCPAGEKLTYTNEEDGKALRRYWTTACSCCPLKGRCTIDLERRIARWEHEHEHVLEAVQQRLDKNPQAMRGRRETVEHPFGTLKMRIGATHFLMKTLACVATEMALYVLAYQPHPRHERHWGPTAHGGNEGIVIASLVAQGGAHTGNRI